MDEQRLREILREEIVGVLNSERPSVFAAPVITISGNEDVDIESVVNRITEVIQEQIATSATGVRRSV